ncbi:MurR/RpiR family transcriptional regulator [Paenibacillus sp. y28]|uniref:MurR/RpiR family transcriptional regulator n=1 Tax=Paenibacillus sp. y28 TaxID=3129110 RepID=UPI00301AF199
MSILHAIEEQLDSLHPKERELAAYILRQPQQAVGMSITELAREAGGSTATVSRFCRMLHFQSFADFKIRLAAELGAPASPAQYQDIVAGRPLQEIVAAIEANHIRSITDTTRLLDIGQLLQAIRVLDGARRIDLYGVATSGIVAEDFGQKLVRIGKFATAFSDPHLQLTSASSLGKEDAAIGISYSGETPETIRSLQCAAANGATTISITRFGANTLAGLADLPLFASSAEAGMRRGDMASRIAQLHVIDILFTGLVSERFDSYVPLLEQSFQAVRHYTGKEERGK